MSYFSSDFPAFLNKESQSLKSNRYYGATSEVNNSEVPRPLCIVSSENHKEFCEAQELSTLIIMVIGICYLY